MQFERDLRLGMSRTDVETYLRTQKISYDEINWNYDEKVGEDPSGSIFCEKWDVYIEMRFIRPQGQFRASPADNLDNIFIQKIGTCL